MFIITKRKAVYYGQVELIPGCDGYVLDDDTAVMSERGTADFKGVHHKFLQSVAVNWRPKTLKPFIDKGLSMRINTLVAKNSLYKGINIYRRGLLFSNEKPSITDKSS
jgi:hypothetical protein